MTLTEQPRTSDTFTGSDLSISISTTPDGTAVAILTGPTGLPTVAICHDGERLAEALVSTPASREAEVPRCEPVTWAEDDDDDLDGEPWPWWADPVETDEDDLDEIAAEHDRVLAEIVLDEAHARWTRRPNSATAADLTDAQFYANRVAA